MESANAHTEAILKELGGCGLFQVILGCVAYLPQIVFTFTNLFMSFGAYDPGWICLDHTDIHNQSTMGIESTSSAELAGGKINQTSRSITDACNGFETCKHLQYNPETSTIVTEFRLSCDNGWVLSSIMALQMAGTTIGTLCSGFLGDRFGRKFTLYLFVSLNLIMNVIGIFSNSWKMYMAVRFFLGMTCAIIGYIPCFHITEFVPPQWRVRISSLPFWTVGAMVFSLVAMATKNWMHMHIITAVIAAVALLPVFWVPESLRWLLVNKKRKRSFKVAKQISKLNGTMVPEEQMNELLTLSEDKKEDISNAPSIIYLFKRRLIKYTLVIGSLYMSMDAVYYSTSFGVSSLPGDMYVNLIVIFATEVPSNLVSATIPNILGRKIACIASYITMTVSLISVVLIDICVEDEIKAVGMLVGVVVCRLGLCVAWYTTIAWTSEIYPTVVRSAASGYGALMAAVGGIIAPYIIPSSADLRYISYSGMAVLCLVCTVLILLLPETKGKPLPDALDDRPKNQNHI